MKALIIGLGGAGSRIADILYDHDRRSKTHSLWAIAVDTDIESITKLQVIPQTQRIVLPRFDNEHEAVDGEVLDVAETIGHIQKCTSIEIDAVIICAGLGGMHANTIPLLVEKIRDSFYEPVLCLLTLPLKSEGRKISARAADQLDMIEPVVDGCIIFDNETWYRKIATDMLRLARKRVVDNGDRMEYPSDEDNQHEESIITNGHLNSVPLNPAERNMFLNERLARRFGLLLRAGEFVDENRPVGEVVLDAGEVINTITGMGMISIGYAIELVSRPTFGIFNKFKKNYAPFEDGHIRASRMVDLAKRAIYQEISVPCDLTSAQKALVLIAGPTEELSMKGFQTVRKWIDRSISGLEMRAGDYPLLSTKYIGVIIVLAGITNIPRINEIKEIRSLYIQEQMKEKMQEEANLQEREYFRREKQEMERKAREKAERAALLARYGVWEDNDNWDGDTKAWPEDTGDHNEQAYPVSEADPVHANARDYDTGFEPEMNKEESRSEIGIFEMMEADYADETDKKLSLPGREATEIADISRQTRVPDPVKPRDRSIDDEPVRVKEMPKERSGASAEPAGGSFTLPSTIRARDVSYEAKAIALKSHFSRPGSHVDESTEITIQKIQARPRDDVLMGRGVIGIEQNRRLDTAIPTGHVSPLQTNTSQPPPKDDITRTRNTQNHPLPRDEVKDKSGYVFIEKDAPSRHRPSRHRPSRHRPSRREPDEEEGGITWI